MYRQKLRAHATRCRWVLIYISGERATAKIPAASASRGSLVSLSLSLSSLSVEEETPPISRKRIYREGKKKEKKKKVTRCRANCSGQFIGRLTQDQSAVVSHLSVFAEENRFVLSGYFFSIIIGWVWLWAIWGSSARGSGSSSWATVCKSQRAFDAECEKILLNIEFRAAGAIKDYANSAEQYNTWGQIIADKKKRKKDCWTYCHEIPVDGKWGPITRKRRLPSRADIS